MAIAAIACLAIAAVGGASLAMTGKPSGDVKPGTDRYRCFDPTFVRGFQTPNDNTVIIESDDNQAYELTMSGACFGLSDSFAIGIRSRTGMNEVCDPFDADILFRDNTMGERRECRVMSIRHLTGDEAASHITPVESSSSASEMSAVLRRQQVEATRASASRNRETVVVRVKHKRRSSSGRKGGRPHRETT